mmetsp:Transcript_3877/g.10644  ORF Transcript_3877/g.10644 Transcript_3877/m.10644 type:complete len:926 (-) Transcript_3877:656-3433(-)
MFHYTERAKDRGNLPNCPPTEICEDTEARQERFHENTSSGLANLSEERDESLSELGKINPFVCADDNWADNWFGSLLCGRAAATASANTGALGSDGARSTHCPSCEELRIELQSLAQSHADIERTIEKGRHFHSRSLDEKQRPTKSTRAHCRDTNDNLCVVTDEEGISANSSSSEKAATENPLVPLRQRIGFIEQQIKNLDSVKEEEVIPQKEDIYSLFEVTPWCSGASMFSTIIFFLQMIIFLLCLVDLAADGSPSNPFDIPPGVGIQVTVAQFLALIITLGANFDFITSLAELVDGYDPVLQELVSIHATKFKWTLSNSFRLLQGALGIVVSFILVVQSDAVIDLFFNFAALSFISELDNIAFFLVSGGFIFRRLRKDTELITTIKIPRSRCQILGERNLAAYFVPLAFLPVLFGWVYVVNEQARGKYLAQSVTVQFGAPRSPHLGVFSGVYDLDSKREGGRVVYTKRNVGNAMFAYCKDEKAWTFTYNLDAASNIGNLNACDWKAKSEEALSYSLLSTSNWAGIDEASGSVVPFPFFSLLSNDCGLHENVCGKYGECVDRECVCEKGRYGVSCQYELPCPVLILDGRGGDFPDPEYSEEEVRFIGFEMVFLEKNVVKLKVQGLEDELHERINPNRDERLGVNGWRSERVGNSTTRIHFLEVNGRPVYMRRVPLSESFHILFFLGRRWTVTSSESLKGIEHSNRLSEVASFMSSTFPIAWTSEPNIDLAYVSGPTDSRTPSDIVTPTHDRLQWYQVLIGPLGIVYSMDAMDGVSFNCALCDEKHNVCHNSGRCTDLSDWKDGDDFYSRCTGSGGDTPIHENGSRKNNPKRLVNSVEDDWGYCECPLHTTGALCEILASSPDAGCYAPHEDGLGDRIPGCVCHESCKTCGVFGSRYNCFSCFEGANFTQMDTSGEGCCGKNCSG